MRVKSVIDIQVRDNRRQTHYSCSKWALQYKYLHLCSGTTQYLPQVLREVTHHRWIQQEEQLKFIENLLRKQECHFIEVKPHVACFTMSKLRLWDIEQLMPSHSDTRSDIGFENRQSAWGTTQVCALYFWMSIMCSSMFHINWSDFLQKILLTGNLHTIDSASSGSQVVANKKKNSMALVVYIVCPL